MSKNKKEKWWVPDGWRILKERETPKRGDRYWSDLSAMWIDLPGLGGVIHATAPVRLIRRSVQLREGKDAGNRVD